MPSVTVSRDEEVKNGCGISEPAVTRSDYPMIGFKMNFESPASDSRKSSRMEEREEMLMEEPLNAMEQLPSLNAYQQRKTVAQGMMDIALFSANATQLKFSIQHRHDSVLHMVCLVFISISLVLQIVVGVCLIWNSRYDIMKADEIKKANRANNFSTVGIFIITLVNIFIATFSVHNDSKL